MSNLELPEYFRLRDALDPIEESCSIQASNQKPETTTITSAHNGRWILEVEVIQWMNPYTPISHWTPMRSWATFPTTSELHHHIRSLLNRSKLFITCDNCKQHFQTGHTNGSTCHSCLEKFHNVVF